MPTDFASRVTVPPNALPLRLARAVFHQGRRTPRCPDTPRLDGKLAVVTGGNTGIGIEIARGLARRGAEVVIAARNPKTAAAARDTIASATNATVHRVPLDLSDLASVVKASDALRDLCSGRGIDVFVANACIWPQKYECSAQGHEMAFATNTLGHHVLVRRLLAAGLLPKARVVVVMGDIYIRARECTSDFTYTGTGGGGMAYCRSKLGNLWFAAELGRRHPELEIYVVHPGVIASGLGGASTGFAGFMRNAVMLDLEAGAQTPLWCATQPDLERGGYYHNTMGLVRLGANDPASSRDKAAALWDRMEQLGAAFI
jgi:NAD(P)-dependent dehydrogenase (short-subunit alcohol dehydrogenase family)